MGVHKVSAFHPFICQKSGKSTIIRNLAVPRHFVPYLVFISSIRVDPGPRNRGPTSLLSLKIRTPVANTGKLRSIGQVPVIQLIRTLIILVQDKNTSLKLPVGVSPLQLVNIHRNRRYFVIKHHTWFCLSYFLKTNIKFYCIYQYFMSINSFFNTVSVS